MTSEQVHIGASLAPPSGQYRPPCARKQEANDYRSNGRIQTQIRQSLTHSIGRFVSDSTVSSDVEPDSSRRERKHKTSCSER